MSDGGAGGGGPPPPAPTRVDAPAEYSFLTIQATTEMCDVFEEAIKGQSNRELLSDFNHLIESAVTLALGDEVGGALDPRNATDAQQRRALEVIVQGMILEKKLEGTRQEARMEALMKSDKFEGIVSCMPQDQKGGSDLAQCKGQCSGAARGRETRIKQGAVDGLLLAKPTRGAVGWQGP